MSASYDYLPASVGSGSNTRISASFAGKVFMVRVYVSVAAILAADGGSSLASSTQITAAEDIGVYAIPKNTIVRRVRTNVITASTDTTATIDIGDDDDDDGFDSAVDITSDSTNAITIDGTDAYGTTGGNFYSSNDTLDVLFNNDTTNGVFNLVIMCYDLSDAAYDD